MRNSNDHADESLLVELNLAAGVVAERIGDSFVLVQLEANQIYELQGTAARIFELIQEGRRRHEIERALLAEYAVEASTLAHDIDRHLLELRRKRILR